MAGAEGRIQLSSIESGVDVEDVVGEITVEAVNGSVSLDRIRSRLLEAASVNGNVEFSGWIDDGGRYKLATHSGNVDVTLPEHADATVSVSTFNGGFESEFPVRVSDPKPGKNFSFTLGDGKALLQLECFEGQVRVRRGGPGKK